MRMCRIYRNLYNKHILPKKSACSGGAALLPTLLQLVYACAVGFLFTVLFYKGGSLWPCMITHGVLNALSAFAVEGTEAADMLTAAALTVISVLYALWILKHGADKTE